MASIKVKFLSFPFR